MKRIVLTFGVISGAISALMMFASLPFIRSVPFEYYAAIGYTTFVASFLMVFFGIRSYRDNVGGGAISFGRAFQVGILITLISCAIYAVTWDFIYHRFFPDFLDQYSNYMIEKMRAQGATAEAVSEQMQLNVQFKEWYRNPVLRYGLTLMEAFPVGLLVTLISAWVLRKRPRESFPRQTAT